MQRRLTPARSTCEWATRRQDALSQRRFTHQQPLRHAGRDRAAAKQPGPAGRQRTTGEGQPAAVHGGGPVGGGHPPPSHRGPGELLPPGGAGHRLALSPETTAAFAIPVVVLTIWWLPRRLHRRVLATDAGRREKYANPADTASGAPKKHSNRPGLRSRVPSPQRQGDHRQAGVPPRCGRGDADHAAHAVRAAHLRGDGRWASRGKADADAARLALGVLGCWA